MSPELIGIVIVGVLVAAAAFYFLHSAKGKAELGTLEANLKGELSKVQGQVQTAVADINGHVTQTVANAAPTAPTQAPAPVSPPPAQTAAGTAAFPSMGIALAPARGSLPGGWSVLVNDPRQIPGGTTGYDATKYAVRGAGTSAWEAAGSPYTDVNNLALDNAGWPIAGQSAPVVATTCPWPPGTQWQVDVNNGVTATSTPFTMPANNYRVDATDGLSQGFAVAALNGVAVPIGQPFNVPADTSFVMTMTATPGNPSGPQTRMGCQIHPV